MEQREIIKLVEECKKITKKFRDLVALSPARNENGEFLTATTSVINQDFSLSTRTILLYKATPIEVSNYIKEIENIISTNKNILSQQVTLDLSNLYITAYLNIEGIERELPNITFENTIFNYLCEFRGIYFNNFSNFSHVQFNHGVNFTDANFKIFSDFNNAIFNGKVTFEKTKIWQVSFVKAIFNSRVEFNNTNFKIADFNDAQFKGSTYFENCIFEHPPNFHQTILHDDTTFISSKFDNSFKYLNRKLFDKKNAENNRMAYMRLRQHMTKASNNIYENMFFEYEQRTQRAIYWHEGKYFNWLISWFYEFMSEYGQNIARPVILILALWSIFGIFFTLVGNIEVNDTNYKWAKSISDIEGFGYSFQNIVNPLSLLSKDMPYHTNNIGIVLLGFVETLFSLALIALWLLAVKRRFQKGE